MKKEGITTTIIQTIFNYHLLFQFFKMFFGLRAKRGQRNGPLNETSNPKKPIPLLVALVRKGEG
jgi:hypothetical protein